VNEEDDGEKMEVRELVLRELVPEKAHMASGAVKTEAKGRVYGLGCIKNRGRSALYGFGS